MTTISGKKEKKLLPFVISVVVFNENRNNNSVFFSFFPLRVFTSFSLRGFFYFRVFGTVLLWNCI